MLARTLPARRLLRRFAYGFPLRRELGPSPALRRLRDGHLMRRRLLGSEHGRHGLEIRDHPEAPGGPVGLLGAPLSRGLAGAGGDGTERRPA